MKFSNRESEQIQLNDGRRVWLSRSVAVVAHILCCMEKEDKSKDLFVLMTKRGNSVPNEKNMWCLPCGYLDWEETGAEAVKREVWEETGLNIDAAIESCKHISYNGLKYNTPWFTNSDHKQDQYQNISLHYGLALRVKSLPSFEHDDAIKSNEVSEVKWIPVEEVESMDGLIGFNHKQRFSEFLKYLISEK